MKALDSFQAHSFRGLSAVSIGDLGDFNVLVGSGNSGKTSLLEAIALLCAPLDLREWARVARSRESRSPLGNESLSAVDAVRWLFPHFPEHGPHQAWGDGPDEHGALHLSASGEIATKSLHATCSPVRGLVTNSTAYRTLPAPAEPAEDDGWEINIRIQHAEHGSLFSDGFEEARYVLWNRQGIHIAERRHHRTRCIYLAPYAHRNQAQNTLQLSRAIADEQKFDVVEMLRQLDPDLISLEILTDALSRPVIAVRHRRSGLSPLSTMGDGFRRALMIALSISTVRGGILLIDELEAALHVSALDKIIPWMAKACETFDVQVITTTHSLEAIDAVSRSFAESDNVVAFHLNNSGHAETPKRYSTGMLKRLVNERGLDIR